MQLKGIYSAANQRELDLRMTMTRFTPRMSQRGIIIETFVVRGSAVAAWFAWLVSLFLMGKDGWPTRR